MYRIFALMVLIAFAGCGESGGTAGDENDPALTSDATAMTETDPNAGKPPVEN